MISVEDRKTIHFIINGVFYNANQQHGEFLYLTVGEAKTAKFTFDEEFSLFNGVYQTGDLKILSSAVRN